MKIFVLISLLACYLSVQCQQVTDPVITKWTKSTGTGYGGYLNNVNKIQYSNDYAYISTNSIPSYSIGPWPTNPNNAKGLSFTFKFTRKPTVVATKTKVPLGHIGLWINGVALYDGNDGMSYNNLKIWNRNAYYWEGVSFDSCKGHADQSSEYHNHIASSCIFNSTSSSHSPIVGFAFDGFPIYGPYGYSSALNSSSPIKRIQTSYKLRSITQRTSLSNGQTLSSFQYGPAVSSNYPLGSYIEDYEYNSTYGDLDLYNGRFCKTPEYPDGTYAYFVATDSNLNPTYPFVIGPYFYGTPISSNLGLNSGYASITESVSVYYSYSSNSATTTTASFSTGKNNSTTIKSTTTTKGPITSSKAPLPPSTTKKTPPPPPPRSSPRPPPPPPTRRPFKFLNF